MTWPFDFENDGTPIFERRLRHGFFLVVEAKPGPSGRPVGTQTFNWDPFDPDVLPDLQIVTSRPLGNASAAVCDSGPSPLPLGGVPAINPPLFGGSQAASNAVNDLACRFDARESSGDACTRNQFQEDTFIAPDSTVQFCTVPGVGAELAFPVGDTRLTVRVRDVVGQPGMPASMIVRVLGQ